MRIPRIRFDSISVCIRHRLRSILIFRKTWCREIINAHKPKAEGSSVQKNPLFVIEKYKNIKHIFTLKNAETCWNDDICTRTTQFCSRFPNFLCSYTFWMRTPHMSFIAWRIEIFVGFEDKAAVWCVMLQSDHWMVLNWFVSFYECFCHYPASW